MTKTYAMAHVKGSPYSIAERRVPELIPVLGSQPAGDVSHKPGGIGCHYFPSGLQLPSQSLRGLLPISLLVNRGTMGVNSLPKTASRLRFEPRPFCARVRHANHSVTEPPCSLPYYADRAHGEKRKATLWCLSRLLSNVSAAMIYCIYCLQAMPRSACLSVHYRAMVTIEQ